MFNNEINLISLYLSYEHSHVYAFTANIGNFTFQSLINFEEDIFKETQINYLESSFCNFLSEIYKLIFAISFIVYRIFCYIKCQLFSHLVLREDLCFYKHLKMIENRRLDLVQPGLDRLFRRLRFR